MKRRLFSILLTLALCLGLMPMTAIPVHAASYDLWIAGVRVTDENKGNLSVINGVDVAAGGKASFDPVSNILTLENATITSSVTNAIDVSSSITEFKIVFAGANRISAQVSTGYCRGINALNSTLILSGEDDANLTIQANMSGDSEENGAIRVGALNITGGTVFVECPLDQYGPSHNPYCISLNNSKGTTLTVSGGKLISKGWEPLFYGPNAFSAAQVDPSTDLRGTTDANGTNLETYDFTTNSDYSGSSYNSTYRYVIAEHALPAVAYDLYIAGTQVTASNASNVLGDGKVSYDAGTKTLTLNGVSLTSGGSDSQVWGDESDADRVYAPIFSNIQDLTIQVTGENTLTSAGDPGQEPGLGQGGSLSCGIFSLQDLTFTGSGTLNAVGGAARITHGIFSLGDLTVGDTFTGTLSATGGAAKSSSYGILGEKNITITGSGTVTAAGGDATATNGARSVGIYCYDYDNGVLTVGGSANVTATSGKAETGQSYGVLAKQVIVKDSAELTAAAGKAVKSSSNITTLSHGIDADTLTISDNAKVTATGGEVSGGESSYGVKLSQKATVSGGSLIAEGIGGDTCEYSRGLQTPGNSGYGLYITDGTVFLTGGPTKDGGYGFGFAGGDLSLTGGSLTAKTEAAGGSAIKTYGTYNVAVEPVMASTAADGTGAVDYVAANNDTYKWFQAPFDDQEIPTEPTQVATPVLPEPAEFNDSMTVTITCETEGAEIYYTTGGAITLYEGAFNITETTTVEAYATKDGLDESEHTTATYTKTDPTPSTGGGGTTTYLVKPASTENGNITVAPRNAAEKSTVTVTVTPDEGYVLDKLTVKDKDGKEIDVKDNGDGTYTFTMPASAIEIEATFKPEEGAAADGFPFIDVPENSYFRKPVEWAVEKGITNGVSEDKYGPEMSCTRAQVVTFLWITCGSEDAGIETGFDDVDVAAYYDKAVAWAVEKGITAGTSENEFSPDVTVTRAQFVTMLWAAKGMPEAAGEMPFLDVPADAYYAKAVAWAYANDITAGKSTDSFAPDDPCTRAQIMTFLYNAYAE